MDSFPSTCCICKEEIGPSRPSVLQLCGCLIIQCLPCSLLRIPDNPGTYRAGLPCLACGESTPLSQFAEQELKQVEECESQLVTRAFESAKLNLPRRSSESVDKYKPLLEKFAVGNLVEYDLLEEYRGCHDVDRVKLFIARIECLRAGFPQSGSNLCEEVAEDGLPLGPLAFLRLPRNTTMERILSCEVSDWSCGLCGEDLGLGCVPFMNCQCAFWTCTPCCLKTTLANPAGYLEGPRCSMCRTPSPFTFLSTLEAQQEERTLLAAILAKHSQYGRKYRAGSAKDLKELCLNYYSADCASYEKLEVYKQSLEAMRLPQLSLEVVRHDLKTAGMSGPDAELGPLRLIDCRPNVWVDFYLRVFLPDEADAARPATEAPPEVDEALRLFESFSATSTLDELSRDASGDKADVVRRHQRQVRQLATALAMQAAAETSALSPSPDAMARRLQARLRRSSCACHLCAFDAGSAHYLRMHLHCHHPHADPPLPPELREDWGPPPPGPRGAATEASEGEEGEGGWEDREEGEGDGSSEEGEEDIVILRPRTSQPPGEAGRGAAAGHSGPRTGPAASPRSSPALPRSSPAPPRDSGPPPDVVHAAVHTAAVHTAAVQPGTPRQPGGGEGDGGEAPHTESAAECTAVCREEDEDKEEEGEEEERLPPPEDDDNDEDEASQRASREALQHRLAPLHKRLAQQSAAAAAAAATGPAEGRVVDISQSPRHFGALRLAGIYEVVLPCRPDEARMANAQVGDFALRVRLTLQPADGDTYRRHVGDEAGAGADFEGRLQLFSNLFPLLVLRQALAKQWGFHPVLTAFRSEDGQALQSRRSFASLHVSTSEPLYIRPYSPMRIYHAATSQVGGPDGASVPRSGGVRVFPRKKSHRPSQLETAREYMRQRQRLLDQAEAPPAPAPAPVAPACKVPTVFLERTAVPGAYRIPSHVVDHPRSAGVSVCAQLSHEEQRLLQSSDDDSCDGVAAKRPKHHAQQGAGAGAGAGRGAERWTRPPGRRRDREHDRRDARGPSWR